MLLPDLLVYVRAYFLLQVYYPQLPILNAPLSQLTAAKFIIRKFMAVGIGNSEAMQLDKAHLQSTTVF
jgi:hypothetical protein